MKKVKPLKVLLIALGILAIFCISAMVGSKFPSDCYENILGILVIFVTGIMVGWGLRV